MLTKMINQPAEGTGRPDTRFCAGMALHCRILAFAVLVLALVVSDSGFARMTEEPRSFLLAEKALEGVDRRVLEPINPELLLAEDSERMKAAEIPGPLRFAVSEDVDLDLRNSGTWKALPDGRLWRLRIHAPGAVSINLGIIRLDLPKGAKLWIYDPVGEYVEGSYTSEQRNRKGGLWTPVIPGDELVIELYVPAEAPLPALTIGQVNKGYRDFSKEGAAKSGACNNDVVCPEGDPWRAQIRSVALYTISGTYICSGQLMNNTALDFTPYFLSANHCGVSAANDHTLVFYWNFESPNCGDHGGGSLAENQSGATFRALYAPSDFVLVELDAAPVATNVYFSGWDATGTAAASTVGIHHPSGDEKAISFNTDPVTSTDYLSNTVNPAEDHWRVDDWEDGTTENGSSGSCLWDAATHQCIGQLHGGYASCTSNTSDWYGKLSVSWTGAGTSATRLRDWLDPGNTGTLSLNGDPHITTLDGTHYDFQGAGEYVVLRDPTVAEVQVRQAPIATTFNPGPNPYHGLATCVSLNTAVVARVGKRRVTYQPDLSGVPNPNGLQLRVDGELMNLGPMGIDLGNGGRIVQTSAPGGLEIVFPAKYILRVTPGWWASQSKWYLNVVVLPAPATATSGASPGDTFIGGIAGPIAPRSWLPALPDGSSMGPMPASLHDRYMDLYEKFGEAWRVTDRTSLFDYAQGTSTTTFTLKSWPCEKPPCELPNVTPVKPVSLRAAQKACAEIQDTNMRADCVFDVRVTGEFGFAETYLRTENATPVGSHDEHPHFQCYRVDDPSKETEDLTATLEDQFGFTKTKLGRITQICTPVNKNGEGIPDKRLHLVCYEILNPSDPGQPVQTANQFGRAKMYVRESQELCVPSTKRILIKSKR